MSAPWTLKILAEPDYLDGIQSQFDIKAAKNGRAVAYAFVEQEARLIAAAPAMYEALKALQLQALQSPDLLKTEWGMQALDQARAAISQATGEQS